MAWIESHQTLRDHRKTKRVARLLEIPRIYVVGHLQGAWWWALDNAPEGYVAEQDVPSIAEASEYTGDSEAFVSALLDAGFLDKQEGGVAFHDWDDYAGKLALQRATHAEKQRRYRVAQKARETANSLPARDNNVTPMSPSRMPSTGPDTTVHDRRGPDPQSVTRTLPSRNGHVVSQPSVEEYPPLSQEEENGARDVLRARTAATEHARRMRTDRTYREQYELDQARASVAKGPAQPPPATDETLDAIRATLNAPGKPRKGNKQ